MIRIDDIWNYQMLIGAKETIDNLRSDVRLAKHIEGRDQETQGNVSDNEMQHLNNLTMLEIQLEACLDRIQITLKCMNELEKDREYEYKIGVHYPDFADQNYLRDRDEWIAAKTPRDAIAQWLTNHKGWIRREEREMIKVFESKRVEAAEADDDHDEEDWDEMAKAAEYELQVLNDHVNETAR